MEHCSPSAFLRLSLVAILLLAAALRLAWLGAIPPGINQDEAVHAYDAWCLLHTGMDHYGERWPVFLRAVGDYHSAPFIYLLIPFQALIGPTPLATRLPSALLGCITIWAMFAVISRFYGARPGLLAALMLAISSWHVLLCRLAFEVSITPSLLAVALWLMVSRPALARASSAAPSRFSADTFRLFAAGLLVGLCAWTYNAMRLIVPTLLAGAALLHTPLVSVLMKTPRGRRLAVLFAAGLLIGLLPFIWSSITTPDQAWRRASTELAIGRSAGAVQTVLSILRTYALQLDPRFLFLRGDPSITQSLPAHGQLHAISAVLIPIGIYRLIRRWRVEPAGRLVLFWFLVAPLPAALTSLDAGHALRCAALILPCAVLDALGLDTLLGAATRRGRRAKSIAVAGCTLAIATSAGQFSYAYFVRYPRDAAHAFWPEWEAVVREVLRREADYDLVVLTSEDCPQNGILYLFWSRMDPGEYFAAPRIVDRVDRWDVLVQVGKFFFVPSRDLPALIEQLPPEIQSPRALVAERPHLPVAGRELARFCRPDGVDAMVLYDVGFPRRGAAGGRGAAHAIMRAHD